MDSSFPHLVAIRHVGLRDFCKIYAYLSKLKTFSDAVCSQHGGPHNEINKRMHVCM